MRVERVYGYRHLTPEDLDAPAHGNVFIDPPDTEVGSWVGADLIRPGCTAFDLGSGSGASAAAFVRSGAGHAHGIDSSPQSVAWARRRYGAGESGAQVSFAIADFVASSTAELLSTSPVAAGPFLLASNPAYVPLPEDQAGLHPSIDGGTDGLRYVPAILRHARELGADLALTLGSYCALRKAACWIADAGFSLHRLTLSALTLGAFTRQHPQRVLELERAGEGALWRPPGDQGYLIVGMAWTREPPTAGSSRSPTPDELYAIMAGAALSRTSDLEGIDSVHIAGLDAFPVRVAVLPPPRERHHW